MDKKILPQKELKLTATIVVNERPLTQNELYTQSSRVLPARERSKLSPNEQPQCDKDIKRIHGSVRPYIDQLEQALGPMPFLKLSLIPDNVAVDEFHQLNRDYYKNQDRSVAFGIWPASEQGVNRSRSRAHRLFNLLEDQGPGIYIFPFSWREDHFMQPVTYEKEDGTGQRLVSWNPVNYTRSAIDVLHDLCHLLDREPHHLLQVNVGLDDQDTPAEILASETEALIWHYTLAEHFGWPEPKGIFDEVFLEVFPGTFNAGTVKADKAEIDRLCSLYPLTVYDERDVEDKQAWTPELGSDAYDRFKAWIKEQAQQRTFEEFKTRLLAVYQTFLDIAGLNAPAVPVAAPISDLIQGVTL